MLIYFGDVFMRGRNCHSLSLFGGRAAGKNNVTDIVKMAMASAYV